MGNGTQDPLRGRLFSFGGSIQQSCGLLHGGEERRPPGRPWGAARRRRPGILLHRFDMVKRRRTGGASKVELNMEGDIHTGRSASR